MWSLFSRCVPMRPVAFALAAGLVSSSIEARTAAVAPPGGMLSGPAHVVDGDTIDIAGTRIRLEGIDAPEASQTCQTASGETWSCGTAATRLMVSLTRDQSVDCHSRGLDKYGRLLGICFVGAIDINAEMVRQGYAWAFVKYSQHYVTEEAVAHAALRGVWQGPAVPAWDYRAQKWASASTQAAVPSGCVIKGNVSRTGLVYHMPWSPWYDKVAMRDDKGTRWFCSEIDALAAGWRPAAMR